MNAQDRLRQAIDEQQDRLRADVPSNRQTAILALLQARDRLSDTPGIEASPDIITGRRLADRGGNKALYLCLESTDDAASASPVSADDGLDGNTGLDAWGERFLHECGQLAEAELVLT